MLNNQISRAREYVMSLKGFGHWVILHFFSVFLIYSICKYLKFIFILHVNYSY